MSGQSDKTIVNLRFFALVLVVVGHSIILYSNYWSCFPVIKYFPLGEIKDFINVIQMPIFFAISGFLFNYSINKPTFKVLDFIKGKILRLLIPFVCVLIAFNDPIRFLLSQYDIMSPVDVIKGHLLLTNLYHLWYLPCLFGIFLISLLICKIKDMSRGGELIVFIILMYLSVNPKQLLTIPIQFQIRNIANYLLFFYTGYIVSRYNLVSKIRFRGIQPVAWILFLLILYVEVYSPSIFNTPLTVLACITSFVMVGSKSISFIELISINSLGIYLIHEPLCHITFAYLRHLHPLLVSSINLFICGGVAFLASYYIRKSRFSWIIGG